MKFDDIYNVFLKNKKYESLRNYITETVNSNDSTSQKLRISYIFSEKNNLERIDIASSEDKIHNKVFISPKDKSTFNITEISFKDQYLQTLNRLVVEKGFWIENIFYNIKLMVGSNKDNSKGYFSCEFKSSEESFFSSEEKILLRKIIEKDKADIYELEFKENLQRSKEDHFYTNNIKILFKHLEHMNNNDFFDKIMEYVVFDKNNDFSKEQKEIFRLMYDKNIDMYCFEKFKLDIKTKNRFCLSSNKKPST